MTTRRTKHFALATLDDAQIIFDTVNIFTTRRAAIEAYAAMSTGLLVRGYAIVELVAITALEPQALVTEVPLDIRDLTNPTQPADEGPRPTDDRP